MSLLYLKARKLSNGSTPIESIKVYDDSKTANAESQMYLDYGAALVNDSVWECTCALYDFSGVPHGTPLHFNRTPAATPEEAPKNSVTPTSEQA